MIKPYTVENAPENWSVEKWKEYAKIISSFKTFEVSEKIQQRILTAIHDEQFWDWYLDCNGANLVSEPGWKGHLHPAYIWHDYAWGKFGPSIKANNEMSEIELAYGMDPWRSRIRWIGVTCFGLPVHLIFRFFKNIFAKPAKSKYRNSILK